MKIFKSKQIGIHLMLSSMKLKTHEACFQLLTNNTNKPTKWIEIKAKDMKPIRRRRSQVIYHYKSHLLPKNHFISYIVHDIIHYPYCMLTSTIMQSRPIIHLSIPLLLDHDFNLSYFRKLSILTYSIISHLHPGKKKGHE